MSYDLAIIGGRVIDPESGLDAIRNVGVRWWTHRNADRGPDWTPMRS